jgi:ATP-binding cassette subfamily B protein
LPALVALFAAIETARFATSFGEAWSYVTFLITGGTLVRRNIIAAILDRPGAVALPVPSGAAVNRLRGDIDETADFPTWFPQVAAHCVGPIITIAIMARIDLPITLFVFLPLVVAAPVTWAVWNKLREAYKAEDYATDEVTGFLAETFGSVQAVKLAGSADDMVGHFAGLNRTRQVHAVRWRVIGQISDSITATAVTAGVGIVLLLAGPAMVHHTFSVGDFALFIYFLQFNTEAAASLGNFLGDYAQQAVCLRRMEEMVRPKSPLAMVEPHPVVPASDPPGVDRHVEPLVRVDVQGLTCLHEGGGGIRNVDLSIRAGTLTVITGEVGSGKTTMLRAMLGLLPAQEGQIHWNGTLVEDLSTFFGPPQTGYLPQVPKLFSETVIENILMGWPASAGEIDDALRLAVLEDDVPMLSNRLQTVVGPRGVRLSGGQIQRVATARAFIRKPQLLVVDDLSSALDVQTECVLWDRLLARHDLTVLAVSHRREALARADEVIVMRDGAVAARGPLTELLAESDEMRRLWDAETHAAR